MWAATSCSLAGGATPAAASPPATRRARTARAVAPQAPLVLERRADAQAEGAAAAPAASASGQPAVSGSSFSVASWQLSWQARLHPQQQDQHQLQLQQGWVQGGLALAGSAGVLPAWEASPPSTSARSDKSSSSSSSRDGTAMAALASDAPVRVHGLEVQQLNEPPQPQPPRQQGGDAGGSGGGSGGRGEPEKEFFANVGDAIRTLREDYPLLFVKDLNYSIYRDDLAFKDPNLSFHGLKTYRAIFWGLRFHGKLLLKAANVRVLRIWQPEDQIIKLRWQINATPRLGGTPGTFDGISIYRLDKRGRVYQHEVTDVQLRDPPITNPLLYGLNFILSPRPQVQQVPCPGSWFVDGEEEQLPDMLAAGTPSPVLASSASADGG